MDKLKKIQLFQKVSQAFISTSAQLNIRNEYRKGFKYQDKSNYQKVPQRYQRRHSEFQDVPLNIRTEGTPNPASYKFLEERFKSLGIHEFKDVNSAKASPLAQELFQVNGVQGVFFGDSYITVTKNEDFQWLDVATQVSEKMENFIKSGKEIINQELQKEQYKANEEVYEGDDAEIVAMINELLDTRIRPVVNGDGGDVNFKRWDKESGIVYLKMQGACSGCPSSWGTLKNGVQEMLKHYIEEVKSVEEAEPDEAELQGLEEFNHLEKQLSN